MSGKDLGFGGKLANITPDKDDAPGFRTPRSTRLLTATVLFLANQSRS
ncbi:hypothetical protein FB009_11419 [Sinorhizobium medicae]|nr:hypothetical protein FB006_11414 [Sinorhizobium medicae]TWA28235.1 hypothetical protein FB007_12464 [Sinorhizobium medicae]TWA34970.1 hypothetical protein FB009_11419 [Sinorhizobium medicae]TWA40031.1 hypothetical protein FB005_114161 [Sinorhizobium medicae]